MAWGSKISLVTLGPGIGNVWTPFAEIITLGDDQKAHLQLKAVGTNATAHGQFQIRTTLDDGGSPEIDTEPFAPITLTNPDVAPGKSITVILGGPYRFQIFAKASSGSTTFTFDASYRLGIR